MKKTGFELAGMSEKDLMRCSIRPMTKNCSRMGILVIFLTVTLMFFSSCIKVRVYNDNKYKMSDKAFSFAQSYPILQPAVLKLSTTCGNISVQGYQGDRVEVSFIVSKNGRVLDITLDELKKMADVKMISTKSDLEINVSNISERNICVGFEVKTPMNTASVLNTSGGNVSVSDLIANQNMNTSGGNIHINNIMGKVDANTSGGNVSIDHSTGDINASTSGGNISVNQLKGNIKTSTSGGNIQVADAEGSLDVSTSGGSIHVNGDFGFVKAHTSGGNISASIKKLTEHLEMETSGGNIDCVLPRGLGLNLDLSADFIETPLSNFTGTSKKDRVLGTMNGGGIPVTLKTSGGSMNLNYK